ncbi:MAG: DUF2184 domain-containing protein [Hafnia sp.]
MAAITPSYTIVNPSYIAPELIIGYQQASGAFETIASGNPQVRLGVGDQYVYLRKLDIRTQVTSSQSGNGNQLPSVAMDARMISTPTYLFRCRGIYDHHDTAAAGNWNVALPEAQRLGMRQGIFQQLRTALLFGMTPAEGEGLLNTAGATTETLPADTEGNSTVLSYDHGQLAQYLLGHVQAALTRTMQLGRQLRVVILGPQRILGAMEIQQIVQLTSYQRPGGGTDTVGGTVKQVLKGAGVQIDWVYDDTLIGAGAGGTDAVIITIPEVEVPMVNPTVNTNEFAKLSPSLAANALMFCDMAAPREIPTPIAGGAVDVLAEMRSTSGWAVRPEAITILSMAYTA